MIRKTSTIIIFIFFSVTTGYGQNWDYGISLQANYCDIVHTKNPSNPFVHFIFYTEPKIGWGISMLAERKVFDWVAFDLSLGYSLQGGARVFDGDRTVGSLHYLQLSPGLVFTPFKNFPIQFFSEGRLSWLINSNLIASGEIKKIDFSLPFGVGYKFNRIHVNLKYVKSLTSFYTTDIPNFPSYTYYNRFLQLGVSYHF